MKRITSRDNIHFRELKKLCHSSRERRKKGQIVLDGMHLVESFIACHGRLEEVVFSESGLVRVEIARFAERGKTSWPATVLPDALFNELSNVETPSGILAVVPAPPAMSELDDAVDAVVLDSIQEPGNMGSILRTAAAAGVRQVLLSSDCAQAWSPKVLRAGMGAHFLLNIHEGCDLMSFLKGYRGQSIATALNAADELFSLDLKVPCAWIFGNEGQGVRPQVLSLARRKVGISMPGAMESLNVTAAAAICLFEMVRQRR